MMSSQFPTRAEKEAVEGMTLGQIRAERERVEGQILGLLHGLKKDTGLDVQEIRLESLTTSSLMLRRPETTVVGVRLKLEDL